MTPPMAPPQTPPDTANTPPRLLVRGGLVLSEADAPATHADILIEHGKVAALGAPGQFDTLDDMAVLDAHDRLVMPAWANGHTHAHGGLGRGAVDDVRLEGFLAAAPAINGHRGWQDMALSATLTAVELLKKGCTALFDMSSEFPLPTVDGLHAVATFDDILALLAKEVDARGRAIGLVPELKHPSHFAARGLDLEAALVRALAAHAIARRVPLWLQCFEPGTLRRLRAVYPRGGNVRLLQLIGAPDAAPFDTVHAGTPRTYLQLLTEGLRDIATYADAIGPAAERLAISESLQADVPPKPRRVRGFVYPPHNATLAYRLLRVIYS